MPSQLDDRLIIRYLLGQVSEQQGQDLEDRYFGDDDLFEHLRTVEEELIDAYAAGELDAADRKRFEERFLNSPERRKRVEFAKALLSSTDRRRAAGLSRVRSGTPHSTSYYWRPQPLALVSLVAALVIAFVVLWPVTQNRRLRTELAQVQAGQAALRTERQTMRQEIDQQRASLQQLNQSLEQERIARDRLEQASSATQRSVATFILTPGAVRSTEQSRSLEIRTGTDLVQFQISLQAADAVQYQVAVRTPEDREIWSQDGLQARRMPAGTSILMSLPARLLTPGNYVVFVRGVKAGGEIDEAGQYSFTTVRQ